MQAKKLEKPKTICGATPEQIRKFYFTGKLDELFAAIQAEGKWNDDDIRELGTELERLRGDEKGFVDTIREKFSGKLDLSSEITEPTVAELIGKLSEEDEAKMKEWRSKRDQAVGLAREMIGKAAKSVMTGKVINKQDMMNDAHAMTGLMLFLSDDKAYKEVLLIRKQFELKERYGGTRKEAEDRSKVTQEYIEYRKASNLLELADQFIMNAKKEYGGQYR